MVQITQNGRHPSGICICSECNEMLELKVTKTSTIEYLEEYLRYMDWAVDGNDRHICSRCFKRSKRKQPIPVTNAIHSDAQI